MGWQPKPRYEWVPVTPTKEDSPWSYWRDWFSSTPCLLMSLGAGVLASAGSFYGLWEFGFPGIAIFGVLWAAQGLVKQHYAYPLMRREIPVGPPPVSGTGLSATVHPKWRGPGHQPTRAPERPQPPPTRIVKE